ncbi:glycoside hydrolase family 2 protein [Cryobacterium arcticum]|uniref:glycoside hydrolase family 2 protein n=1 Tax=Cryobacterium arcticum TaxID=670052 RepID=UPI002006FFB4|nr:glycoside hydrolase family 2 protein [Cryobacterium arcticum]
MTETRSLETALLTPSVRVLADWSVTALAGPVPANVQRITVPATVPGSVHTDLLSAELIPDPYLDGNENLLSWIGLTDWRYSTTFVWNPAGADRVELNFGGLDTVAEIDLNGVRIGATRNMHRSYTFDVTARLKAGLNELVVVFRSPVREADAASLSLGYRPHVNHHPFNALRKMACSFGWDWGIDTATSGLWKPVTLVSWSTARLGTVRPVATVSGTDGLVAVHVDVARATDAPLAVTASCAGVSATVDLPAGATSATVHLTVPDVDLWWPIGYGEHPLYDLGVSLHDGSADGSGDEVDSSTTRIGFRTVELDTTPDAAGTPFTIVVNGTPVFVRGANWIPDDAFLHRVTKERYLQRLEQAEFANINLIRVWGGGIFETEDFYDLCDERGLLTWQDFLLACAAYAEEDPLAGEIVAEARENVARLAAHPSLVVLNGNNENIWGHEEWNWKLRLDGKTWGAGYYYETFPAIVAELAPHIGYTPGSPFSPGENGALQTDRYPNDSEHGTMHIWDLWNQRDYPAYREYEPRFVAEFGWQGPPTWSTLTESIHDAPLTPESPGMLVHQKAAEGNVKLTDGLIPHLPLPDDIDDWHWAMSLNQANAISTAVEHFRSLSPHCMGSIVWQLNDCWPVTSWAAVDGYGRPKPLLYAIKHAYADRLVTVQPRGNGLAVALVNDSAEPWAGELTVRRHAATGEALAEHVEQVSLPARGTVTVLLPAAVAEPTDAAGELLRADLGGVQGHWFFTEARDSELTPGTPLVEAERTASGYSVRVRVDTLTRDLALLVDKVDPDALVDDMLVTLLPGESTVFTVTSARDVDPAAFAAPNVLRSTNQLVRA